MNKGSLTPNKKGIAGSFLMQFIDNKMYRVKIPYLEFREWIGSCSIGLVKSKGGDVTGVRVGEQEQRARVGLSLNTLS